MIRIWGRPTSICTQRALWCLVECGLSWELILASAIMGPKGHVSKGGAPFGVVDTAEYAAMNPNRTIPIIDDDGFVLWESNAILIYLAMTYAPRLYQNDARTMAWANTWIHWSGPAVQPGLAAGLHVDRLAEPLRDPAVIEAGEKAMVEPLRILDRHLADHHYLAGDAFTIGDISVAPAIHRYCVYGLARPATPHIDAWLGRLAEREGFQTFLAPREHHYDPTW